MKIRWQPLLRALLALFAVGFAVVVYLAIRERTPAPPGSERAPRTDPKAVAESYQGTSTMARGAAEDFRIDYDRALTYQDGSLRFEKVKVFVPQRQGRDITVAGQHATVTNNQSDVAMDGEVRLATSDGLTAAADSGTYQHGEGMLRVPGPMTFDKGRLTGRGVGATFDRVRDVLWLLKDAHITIAPDPATGTGKMDVTADRAGFARRDRYMRFEGHVRLLRDSTEVEADTAVAFMAATEDRIEMLELRGNSRVRTAAPEPGGLEAMQARDINLAYGPDGRTLQRAMLAAQSSLQIRGPAGQQPRTLRAEWIDLGLGADGATVSSLVAREAVDLEIPGDGAEVPSRRIRSVSLEGRGEGGAGMTAVRFQDNVEFREQQAESKGSPAVDRTARSKTLDAQMRAGLGGLDRATFAGGVTFRDRATTATAPDAVYDLAQGRLHLEGGPGSARVDDDQVTVNARTIDLALASNALEALGDVRSVLKGSAQGTAPAGQEQRRRPGMLRGDQPVNVTAAQLSYEAAGGKAVYTGDARLWQGETAVQGGTITIDDRKGNLLSRGNVRSTWRLEDTDPKSGRKEPKTTVATGEDLVYDDAERRATYTTNARMNGPEGDLRAARIDLFFDATGRALERLEAQDAVTLRSANRTSTGARLTYFAADARYVMHGTPVRVLEQLPTECRETLGRTLTFFRATDSIRVDGNEESRTQTTSGGKCPGPPPGS